LIFLFAFFSGHIYSQQLPQFSQRMIDVMLYNPAYAGTKGHPVTIVHYRSQWLGFEKAPVTQSVSINGKINRIMGIGAYLMKDEIGPSKSLYINLCYSHHIDLNKVALVFGLGGTFIHYGIDGKQITIHEQNDNAVQLGVLDKVWKSDFSFGTYLYNDRFYFGISSQQLRKSKIKIFLDDDKQGIIPLSQHHYVTGGYFVTLLQNFQLEPSFLVGKVIGTPFQVDLNLNVQYMQKFLGGISYRLNDAIIILAGVKFMEKYKFAYSYDLVISNLRNYNSGSHEIIFTVDMPDITNRKSRWHHEYKYDFNPKTNRWRERW